MKQLWQCDTLIWSCTPPTLKEVSSQSYADTFAVQDVCLLMIEVSSVRCFVSEPCQSLAVPRNRNPMVEAFGNSGWAQGSEGKVSYCDIGSLRWCWLLLATVCGVTLDIA